MHSPIYYLTETLDFSRENLKRNMPYDELFYDTIEETDYFDFHNSDNNEPYRREWDSPLELFKNDELFIVEEHNKDFVKVIVTKENIEKRKRLLKQLKIKFLEIEIKALKNNISYRPYSPLFDTKNDVFTEEEVNFTVDNYGYFYKYGGVVTIVINPNQEQEIYRLNEFSDMLYPYDEQTFYLCTTLYGDYHY